MAPKRNTQIVRGFTLSEVLIALAILGVIATFTIPKVLNAQQDTKYKAMAKELAATIAAAYQTEMLTNGISANTPASNLTNYMNYVRIDTSSSMDDSPTFPTLTCSAAGQIRCLRLHNGAVMRYNSGETFGGTATTNVVIFTIDPDGIPSTAKALTFFLYYNGAIKTTEGIPNATVSSNIVANYPSGPTYLPSWFSWE